MTHRQECIAHCKDYLKGRNVGFVFNEKVFDSYYRKYNGSQGNAFSIGLKTADKMIEEYKPLSGEMEFYNKFFD